MKTHNFSAGPCILPDEVFKKASDAILDFDNSLSLIEISHRSTSFVKVMNKCIALVKELLNIPTGYSVLFLQGGASLQFLMVPFNLMKLNGSAAYLNTGTWSTKAINEAKLFGNTIVVGDSSDKNFNYIPKNYSIPQNIDYFHCTSNNTIFGTQIKDFPKISIPIVCDMSSDIFSRKININNFDIIYAGAQKNMGPAGTTMVIVKDEVLNKTGRDIPTMLNYQTHINKESMFNTPPVFSIYVSMLTLEWLKNIGGINYIEKINNEKANLLYQEIDRNSLFTGTSNIEDRSMMNVTFSILDKEKEKIFENECLKNKISGLKGHRSVGGYRASIYNAMPINSIKTLINVMKKVENL
tara:strand:+ start:1560 stop:2621 length:1062 start_codon:yes stop_codon:yes gene_type:complete